MAKEKAEGAAPEKPHGKGGGKPAEKGPEKGGGKPADQAPEKGGAEKSPPKAPKPKKDSDNEAGRSGRRSRGRPMRGLGKRQENNLKKVDIEKAYKLEDGVKILKEITSGTKFDQTIDLVMHLGIDPRHADQMIRGSVSLPRGIGKTKRVIAFCDGDDVAKAKAAGAIETGVDELIQKINDGWTDFDVAIAHPRTMGKVGRLGRVLGPTGKMPSPKNGTVTPDIETAVKDFAAGKIEFRNDAGGNVHAIVGKASFKADDLKENISSFIEHIRRMKPQSSKGNFIKKVSISGTMSPGIQLAVEQ